MTDPIDSAVDLPFEQAKNGEYLKRLKQILERPIEYVTTRSRSWVDGRPKLGRGYDQLHPLIGRVGLESDDELLGRNFYIGPRHIEEGEFRTFSWAAPVAELFFQPDGGGFPGAEDVVVRRTFEHRQDAISNLDDEWVRPVTTSPFTAPTLVVPEAPSRGERRRIEAPSPSFEKEAPSSAAPPPELSLSPSVRGMRSPGAVLRRLAAPRTSQLHSVLATLQPDQHDLASRPADESILIQGHPGTGKTIIAAYRAAYMITPDPSRKHIRSVMLVGPTAGYVKHVEGLVRPLDPEGRIVVTHLEELLAGVISIKGMWSGGIGGEHNDVDGKARGLAEGAVRQIKRAGAIRSGPPGRKDLTRRENLRAIYELIETNGGPMGTLSKDPDQIQWMRKLPPFTKASTLRRYLPLLAQCALALQPVLESQKFEHIIVDEAQDVSPIEWNILFEWLAADGHWTLVGDLNQRRSDATYGSWQEIGDHLLLGDGNSPVKPVDIRRGYRSTSQILRFADKLLPASKRGAESLQTVGPEVRVEYSATAATLPEAAISVAAELSAKYDSGTVAIITVDPGAVIGHLGRLGWRRQDGLSSWGKGERALKVIVPEDARGLEFDAVVVMEPGAFPENLGRQGQLYTSLTRANRELAVVWHKGLPDELRRAARR